MQFAVMASKSGDDDLCESFLDDLLSDKLPASISQQKATKTAAAPPLECRLSSNLPDLSMREWAHCLCSLDPRSSSTSLSPVSHTSLLLSSS